MNHPFNSVENPHGGVVYDGIISIGVDISHCKRKKFTPA